MPGAFDLLMLVFLFALGASTGSFLNVVVLRLPDIKVPETAGLWESFRRQLRGLSYPPSHCPKCNYQLRWYDNFPVFGWIWLGGKCRQCKLPISPRYPLTEALVGLLFAGFYTTFFLLGPAWGPPTPMQQVAVEVPTETLPSQLRFGLATPEEEAAALRERMPDYMIPPGAQVRDVWLADAAAPGSLTLVARFRAPATPADDWPVFAMVLLLTWCLVAASLIDFEHFYIPRWLSYLPAIAGLTVHTLADAPGDPLSLIVGPVGCAWAVGGAVGWVLGLVLLRTGVLRRSFREGMPLLESERDAAGHDEPTPAEWRELKKLTRREMGWEVLFLTLPIGLGLLCAIWAVSGGGLWDALGENRAASAFCGSLLGGLVGGGVIWVVRVLGSLGFGREAMGLGDADLMFGIGCCLGAGIAGIALFPAAMVGLVFAVGRWLLRSRHEIPFGPYLAIASLAMVVLWNAFYDWLSPSLGDLGLLVGPVGPILAL